MGARQGAHVGDDRVQAGLALCQLEPLGWPLGHIGIGIAVVLVPADTRAHHQELAQGHAVVGGPLQLRKDLRDRDLEAPDAAVLDRRTDKGGGHGLGDGEGRPAVLRAAPQSVLLKQDLSIPEHEESRDPVGLHVGVDGPGLSSMGEDRIDRPARQGKGVYPGPGGDRPGLVDSLHRQVPAGLLVGAPEEQVRRLGLQGDLGQRGACAQASRRKRGREQTLQDPSPARTPGGHPIPHENLRNPGPPPDRCGFYSLHRCTA